MIKTTLVPLVAMYVSLALCGDVRAADKASGAEIQTLIGGNTAQGSMLKDRYTEYYRTDGVIRGEGYAGMWSVNDTSMCFQYGDAPENCWEAEIHGPVIIWYKNGAIDGAAVVVGGNPHNF